VRRSGQSQERLTPREAKRLAEQDAAIAEARSGATALMDDAEGLIAEIDLLLFGRPILLNYRQWEGE
jgi:hypothetical protein